MDAKIKEKSKEKYIEAVGRRKTSTARVRITEGSKAHFVVKLPRLFISWTTIKNDLIMAFFDNFRLNSF